MHETDPERALNLLVHDIRAPLGVAHGYLRLLKDNKLNSPDERNRAIAQTIDALARIGRHCDDAASYAVFPSLDQLSSTTVEVREFVDFIEESCMALGADPLSFDIDDDRVTAVIRGGRTDRIAASVAVILCAARRSAKQKAARVAVIQRDGEAQFLFGRDEDRSALVSSPAVEFDAWHGGHGIALPLACRTVTEAGGRIWTCADARGAVAVALPQEASVS
jgi:signal transduction histidine kinase